MRLDLEFERRRLVQVHVGPEDGARVRHDPRPARQRGQHAEARREGDAHAALAQHVLAVNLGERGGHNQLLAGHHARLGAEAALGPGSQVHVEGAGDQLGGDPQRVAGEQDHPQDGQGHDGDDAPHGSRRCMCVHVCGDE